MHYVKLPFATELIVSLLVMGSFIPVGCKSPDSISGKSVIENHQNSQYHWKNDDPALDAAFSKKENALLALNENSDVARTLELIEYDRIDRSDQFYDSEVHSYMSRYVWNGDGAENLPTGKKYHAEIITYQHERVQTSLTYLPSLNRIINIYSRVSIQ